MKYLVYGTAWYGATVEAEDEQQARLIVTAAMMNDVGVALDIKVMETEAVEDVQSK